MSETAVEPPEGETTETEETTSTETGTSTSAETETETSTEKPAGKTYDETYVKNLRDENAKRRVATRELEDKVEKLEKQVKASEREKLSDQERTAKELEEAREELTQLKSQDEQRSKAIRDTQLEADVVKAAVHPDLGIIDPDAAFKLIDRSALEFDEDTGRATNIREVLEQLVEEKPFLVASETERKPARTTSAAHTERSKTTVPTREELAQMDPDEINALWESGVLQDALRSGTIK